MMKPLMILIPLIFNLIFSFILVARRYEKAEDIEMRAQNPRWRM